jgi:hypothetical protein
MSYEPPDAAEPNRENGETRPPLPDDSREAMYARRTSPKEILLLLMLLLVLLLIAVATGRGNPIHFTGPGAPVKTQPPLPTRIPSGQVNPQLAFESGRPTILGAQPPVCSPPGPAQRVSQRFFTYYTQYGGAQMFGLPISQELQYDGPNGRFYQWFERARLEEWPENQGTAYLIQGARIGAEFTNGIVFPQQIFFTSRPGLRYFGETGHGVRTPFLEFWEIKGGLPILGYPIGDEVQEMLPDDKQLHIVQYFERGRLEYHPEYAGKPGEVQIGLLGSALCLKQSKPNITLLRPTPVPLP